MSSPVPWLIVGLGNPGSEYEDTRHNVGRASVELMAKRSGAKFSSHRSQMKIARANLGNPGAGVPVVLAYSRTYMNVSGPGIAGLAKSLGVSPDQILVLHDDLDLQAHDLRLKNGGGSGGHNGLKSITGALKTPDYGRLRIGIGRPPGTMDAARFVLAKIPKSQAVSWDVTYELAADISSDVALAGFTKTQMELHTK